MTDCDAVCRLNYNDVIEYHIRNRADITLVYKKKVPDASEEHATTFEINEDGRITGLTYKSSSNNTENVFINVFVMKKSLLQNIVMDSIATNKNRFMTDIISKNLESMRIMAYEHKGFYAGITSLQAYFESNLAMLDSENRNELFGDRSVFTKIRDSAPTKYGNSAIVKNSLIADGCIIEGEVENSIIFRNVKVARGCKVKNSIIMQNSVLGEHCSLNCIISDKNVTIKDKVVLSGNQNHPFYIGKGIMV